MVRFLTKLFDTSDFPARWTCGHWGPSHGWLHIVSDLTIFAAYFAIPLAITLYISRKGTEVKYPRLFWLFSAFIFTCGTSHLVDAIIFYYPIYRVSGVLKALTGLVSWMTVIALIRALPTALELPGLKRAHDLLAEQVGLHEKTEIELARSNRDLGEYASVVRHEIRDPVCSALFMAELAKESSIKGDQATLHQQLDHLLETLSRVDQRVNDLHEHSFPSLSKSTAPTATDPVMDQGQLRDNNT